MALRNLKREKLLSLERLVNLSNLSRLTKLIKPAGFYQTKPKRLFEFAKFIVKEYQSLENFRRERLKKAREKLLNLYGIGPETADTILLYALEKSSFVIDEYTKRLASKEKLSDKLDYDHLQQLFSKNLPKDVRIYQRYHALIIIEQKGPKASIMKTL